MTNLLHATYTPFRPVAAAGGIPLLSRGSRLDLYYVPGVVCAVTQECGHDFAKALQAGGHPASAETMPAARAAMNFSGRCTDFLARRSALDCETFKPQALTLFLNNRCNLACSYCHVFGAAGPDPETLSKPAIARAARHVAAACTQSGRPMWVVFHGGGEPTLEAGLIDFTLALRDPLSQEFGVACKTYLATNGIMPEPLAARLGACIDIIGLSCDGPADIHDTARARLDGSASLEQVLKTGAIFGSSGCELQIRTTVQRAYLDRMEEIAGFLRDRFRPTAIRFEPAYEPVCRGAGSTPGDPEDALRFASGFFRTREACRSAGTELSCSALMPWALRGPYCNINRHALNLIPGDHVTACFKHSRADQAARNGFLLGRYDRTTDSLFLDREAAQTLQAAGRRIPAGCKTCFNRFHCTFSCPDSCMLDARDERDPEPGYRCYLQCALSFEEIVRAGESIETDAVTQGGAGSWVGIKALGVDQPAVLYRDPGAGDRP
jgi:sulfatase maturation enzyme AslB (radical SAM superfamily)